ncbi:unnamed protein product [Brachionus calyciflorus]|uniref:Uncharacterized protein n=1 Tax=Brachionus calyciflorus TaxID=104777 RepID=A0A814REI5_9BILA|nr:unnamed protein product [Brachionus calyciflorus]
MFILYRFTRSCIAENTFLIKIPCTGERAHQVYDFLFHYAEKLLVKEAPYGGPCSDCYSRFLSSINGNDRDSLDNMQMNDFIDLYLNDEANHCRFMIVFIEFKNQFHVNSVSKCKRILNGLFFFRFHLHKIIKSRRVSELICYAFIFRNNEIQLTKGIDPQMEFFIIDFLEWIECLYINEEFRLFKCSLRRFKQILKEGIQSYLSDFS